MRSPLYFSFLCAKKKSFFRAWKSSLRIDKIFPLWTEHFVNCERSVPNFVITTLGPRLFRFSLKTYPSFNGRWMLYHRPVVALPDGSGSFTGRQRQLYRTAAVKQSLSVERREEEDPWTERRTSTNGNTKVSGFSILRCLARDSYTSTRRSRALYESVPPQHLQALNFVIHSVCAIFACTFLRGFYP